MVKLWRCVICGDPYIGASAPDNCPFCGAHRAFIKLAKNVTVSFDDTLNGTDRKNVEHALSVEVSNSAFYFCAAAKTDDAEGKLLFKALGKVESEHANIWRKMLKLESTPKGDAPCHAGNRENLEESHARETRAIEFYRKAANESNDKRVKQVFTALVRIETDHLMLSEQRLK